MAPISIGVSEPSGVRAEGLPIVTLGTKGVEAGVGEAMTTVGTEGVRSETSSSSSLVGTSTMRDVVGGPVRWVEEKRGSVDDDE
jgi:hypothetical protein